MSAEDDRTKESATVLNKVATAAFPAVGLAPWMSEYDKRTEAVIVGTMTIADISHEVERRAYMTKHPNEKVEDADLDESAPGYDEAKARGGAGMIAFCLNRLASNMHNYAPSIGGIRTRQGIAFAKANNPGLATAPNEEKKRTLWQKMTFQNRGKQEQ